MAARVTEPTTLRLRRELLDAQRDHTPAPMLDCAAHMLLYLDDAKTMQEIGLHHLLDRMSASRVDVGFGAQTDSIYRAAVSVRHKDCSVPDVTGIPLPNRDRGVQIVWEAKRSIYLDVAGEPMLDRMRPALERFGTRAKLARRLEHQSRVFGILCVDQTEERQRWGAQDHAYLDQFVGAFFCPLLAESHRRATSSAALTEAELAVVQLAMTGASYKEIAAILKKSPNTVDNQLQTARRKLGVHNHIGFMYACGMV